MTSRLFIGLELPNEIKDKLIVERDNIYNTQHHLNWEGEEKLHITLKFLGNVGENVLQLMIQRFESIEFEKIEAEFDKFSFFKKNGQLKILFASIKENYEISNFQQIIENETELLGFQKDSRKYYPHVTLLRLKGNEDINEMKKYLNRSIPDIKFKIEKFSIFESRLLPKGSEYIKRKSFNLK